MLIVSFFVYIEINKGVKMVVCLLYMYKYYGYDFIFLVLMLCICINNCV